MNAIDLSDAVKAIEITRADTEEFKSGAMCVAQSTERFTITLKATMVSWSLLEILIGHRLSSPCGRAIALQRRRRKY